MNALEQATRALREFPDRSPSPSRVTRAEIVGSIRAAHSVRYPKLFALAACFVLFATSTAWGARPGKPLYRAYRAVVENLTRVRPRSLPRTYVVPGATAAKPSIPEARPLPVESVAVVASTASVAPIPSTKVAPPTALVGPDDLYRVAHRLHFSTIGGGDMRSALVAWNRYLDHAPDGRFAPEARYNRAIALARLGRNADAVAALRPFADGTFKEYRREEARRLIEALDR